MTPSHAGKVATALVLDALFGEPPVALHPTVWMGRMTSTFEKRVLGLQNPKARRLAGVALALSLPTLVFLSTRALICLTPRRLRWVFEGALISTSLSMRGLGEAAGAVERELRVGNLKEARARVGDLVGRDTADLPAPEVARAAVESVAENTSDGVVAPVLYGLLWGAPGALAYKAINTLDSMLGHLRPPYKDLGRASARLDDLANLLPARLTALLAAAASGRFVTTLAVARRYGPLTKSPNAGWAEAAFAGALDLELGGANWYEGVLRQGPTLGDGHRPEAADIRRAVRLMHRACLLFVSLALAATLVKEYPDG